MATYGFRIHSMAPHLQRVRKTYLKVEDVSSAGGEKDAVTQVYNEILALKGTTQLGNPTYMVSPEEEAIRLAAQEAKEDLAYFTVLDVGLLDRTIEVEVETGRESDHDGIRLRGGGLDTAKGKAPVRKSTVLLIFPTAGDHAFLVSEVRGRTYAGELLIAWMTRLAQRAATTFDDAGAKTEKPWLNWKLVPRMDGQRLDNILDNSSDYSFRLLREGVTAQGQPHSYDLEMVQYGLKKTTKEKVLDVIVRMAERRSKGTEQARREAAAKDVLTLVEPDISKVTFSDGELAFKENGKQQHVTSETVDQLFIYPLGSKRPKVSKLKSSALPVIERIAAQLKSQVAPSTDEDKKDTKEEAS